MNPSRSGVLVCLALPVLLSAPMALRAQAFVPQRPAITVSAVAHFLGATSPGERSLPDLFGGGARVTIAPGHYTSRGLDALDYFTFGGFYSRFPEQPAFRSNATGEPVSATLYGVEMGLHFLLRPAWGLFDPFLAVGAAQLTLEARDGNEAASRVLSPGVGFRTPIGDRFEIRLDGRYLFQNATGTFAGAELGDMTQLRAGLGIGF